MGKQLPIECRARYNMIQTIASELLETFANGNRKDMLAGLEELEPRTALAVLAELMDNAGPDIQDAVARFLKEMA